MFILRLGLLQEHNIGIGVAANHPQLAAVERPVKVGDVFRFEVGDLFSRRTVKRLEPEVLSILVKEKINDGFAIMGEADRPSSSLGCNSRSFVFCGESTGTNASRVLELRETQTLQKPPACRLEICRIRMQEARRFFPASLRPKIPWLALPIQSIGVINPLPIG